MNTSAVNHSPSAHLDLIPFGIIDPVLVSVVAANLQTAFNLQVGTRPDRPSPQFAHIPTRNQFDAARLIKALHEEEAGAPLRLGLLQEDLCLPILTYVFGESQLGGSVAVVSVHRLAAPGQGLYYTRAAKIAVHEVGHLLGLEHCREIDCLMRFSKQLDQLDRLPLHFCTACDYEVSRRRRRMFLNGG